MNQNKELTSYDITPRAHTVSCLVLKSTEASLDFQVIPELCIIFKGKKFEPMEFLELIKDVEV